MAIHLPDSAYCPRHRERMFSIRYQHHSSQSSTKASKQLAPLATSIHETASHTCPLATPPPPSPHPVLLERYRSTAPYSLPHFPAYPCQTERSRSIPLSSNYLPSHIPRLSRPIRQQAHWPVALSEPRIGLHKESYRLSY